MLGLPQNQAQVASAAAPDAPASEKPAFSFHDFLSVINPLQHLPVIGTLYRAITGDTIATPEKIAGDALYGGLWGAVASIADSAFEAVTGKNVGDTVLAFFTGHQEQQAQVAANVPPATTAPAALPADANITALKVALTQKGVDTDLTQRALLAYQKSMTLPNMLLATAQ